ncbi:MAG: GNAT family N-acetyltransferase [Tetrasphaera sp.]
MASENPAGEGRAARRARRGGPKDLAWTLRGRGSDDAGQQPADNAAAGASGPLIRRAQTRDLAPVVALRALMFAAMGTSTEKVSANEWQLNARRWFQVNLKNPAVNVTVAEVNGTAVACAVGEVVDRTPSPGNPTGKVGVLGNVATFPEHRMTGLGQGCVDAVMEWFRESTAVTSVELFATPDGRRRYEAYGFTEHEFPQMRLTIDRTPGPG